MFKIFNLLRWAKEFCHHFIIICTQLTRSLDYFMRRGICIYSCGGGAGGPPGNSLPGQCPTRPSQRDTSIENEDPGSVQRLWSRGQYVVNLIRATLYIAYINSSLFFTTNLNYNNFETFFVEIFYAYCKIARYLFCY